MLQDPFHAVTGETHADNTTHTFECLYRQHEHALFLLASRATKSPEQARDIVQEVFLKLWEKRNNLEHIQDIEAWLYRVTGNKLIDHLRKTAADQRLKTALWNSTQAKNNEPDQLLEARECNQQIHAAINQLAPQRQLIYRLNREEGMNYQAIADTLSISRHTVKNQISFALRSIQRFLGL
ncbi:RNA polymerase sigma factor [Pseudobacter ginsenosidimutans]|uniref:RNA polymerase ECF family sigma subunit n=1 Tax=Pseudobacter ginsenosidimutans TaxID=661488 RepID=A0A4Q7N697_9BACT|nr:RNA polymerase sigma-70 factor [Pseudobacter ginsenosidimutans]QEC45109.1 RNA polymerase sigma-70 factor [Pseudobacter ginsenosidimutans]RZS76605.1 RNA polymerase ECF family sigma subunit [Pseudobacter ginsenosidimutans]